MLIAMSFPAQALNVSRAFCANDGFVKFALEKFELFSGINQIQAENISKCWSSVRVYYELRIVLSLNLCEQQVETRI